MVVSTRVSPVTVGLCIMLCLMAATVHGREVDGMEQGDHGDEKTCSIERNGTLTMFNGETTEVKLPCEYRLADFTCGDYRVKVTPGSAVDQEDSHRFSPDTVWVKVVNAKTSQYVKIRTSVRRLDKFNKGKLSNPWQVKEGSESVVDFANYDQSKAAAVLSKDGVFSVEFSSAERSVVVTCSDDEFISKGLLEALCGAGTTTDAIQSATTTLFPGQDGITDDALVNYVVLNHDNVVQSPTCKDLASKFTSCQDKEKAAMECETIFGDQAECLAGSDTSLRDYYADCLTSVCDDVISALEPMNNYITENCDVTDTVGPDVTDTVGPDVTDTVGPDVTGHCPDGYILNDESCYRLEESSKTFTEALDTCRSEGGQLVTIDSKAENDFVIELLTKPGQPSTEWAWIGLTDRETEGEYRWLGSSDPPSFINMSPVIGNNDIFDCVLIRPEFGWAPLFCDRYAAFVCETSVIK